MAGAQGGEPLNVGVIDCVTVRGEVVECPLGVDRVVENDRVDDQAERAELFFLALVVSAGMAQFAAVAGADVPRERVAALAAVPATLALHNAPKTWRNTCSRPPQTGGSGTRATARVHAPLPFATLIGKATIVAPVTGRVARLANFSTCR